MDPHNNSDQYDFWSGDLSSNASQRPNDPQYQYNTSNAPTEDTQAGSSFSLPFNHEYRSISALENPSHPLRDYDLQFGTPPASPSAPPEPAPLALEDIMDVFALYPNQPSSSAQDSVTPTLDQSSPLGSPTVQIPTPHRLSHAPFGGHSMSPSIPYGMHSNSDSADPRRATFNSDGGPAQSPHPSFFPPAFNTTSNLGFNRPSHVEFQSISPGPSMSTSVPVGPGQHVIHFGSVSGSFLRRLALLIEPESFASNVDILPAQSPVIIHPQEEEASFGVLPQQH
ncbi:hypothetical protein FRC04_008501 [Tulasnella sp. 424]|nr:hypothetical protein FRC04_008501 [Tulasnella sp. 424]